MIALNVACPHCRHSLMDAEHKLDGNPSIRLLLRVGTDERALNLSSLYGSFRYETDAAVGLGTLTELVCPHCRAGLVVDASCDVCGARMGRLSLEVDGEVYFCSRRGCKGHKVELRDLEKSLSALYGKAR